MANRFARNLVTAFAILFASPLAAQESAPCENCYTAEEAREDLTTLYSRLQQEHVDLFARRGRAEYDAHVDSLLNRIDGPVPKTDFHLMLHQAMAFGNVGHAKTEAAMGDLFAYVGEGGAIIPLSATYRDSAMVTDQWAGEGESLPPGSRITGLGGISLAEFESRARSIISADSDRLLRSQIELGLPAYLYFVFGPRESLAIEYIGPDGQPATASVSAMGLGEMYAMQAARPVAAPDRSPGARIHRDLGEGIYYLQPGPFSATEGERGEDGETYTIAPFRAFVEEAFTAISASGATDLVIDLRDNGGGDASFSDLIVARLVEEPYRYASRYEVRAGPNTKAAWADREGDANTLAGRIAAALASADDGQVVSVDLPLTQPIADNAFDGRVWMLVNQHSYSNAAVVAALMQDLGIATVVGEETADLPTTYGAVETFALPNSGAVITYPKAYMVRPSGDQSTRGVVPDFVIAPNPVGSAEDVMLETALVQIRTAR